MRSRTPDRLCAEAVDLARTAAEETAGADVVGEHLGATWDGDRVVTHSFVCKDPAYRGWRWAVTVARASRAKLVTVDETVLLPDADAVLAPEWVPWSDRLRPGDMGPGDLLPTEADDLRLEPGWLEGPESVEPAPQGLAEIVESEDVQAAPPVDRAGPVSLAEELGLRRDRVLSRYGLHIAADRWDEAFGPKTPMAQAAPAHCVSCGFLVPLSGSLRQAFGICANEFSPADGRVVSLAYGCGGHSEAAVMPKTPRPAPPVLDELRTEPMPLHPERTGGSVDPTTPDSEELGHS
ncbi:DUF3027 domain-containing protein [Streptomyces sp. ICBB 8177]|uniref:DUF3027 domain-containing protein n=1 Tax=Streptomyces sp. ICBB 8177 TaxID=563922 RepID=UPI000D67EE95|nr:DUF3027 domain-containing protein [Streptomyces sp. ICBB 8177]PWI45883.1 hypothetical protein CK485_01640 [Streptomyces sp. ICBB 8177]